MNASQAITLIVAAMLMRIGNTVPNLRFRSLPGSGMTGKADPAVATIARRFGEAGTRSTIQRLLFW